MDAAQHGFVAVNRFGLGPRPGELALWARDPRGRLKAELDDKGGAPEELRALPTAADGLAVFLKSRRGGQEGIMAAFENGLRQRYIDEVEARALLQVRTRRGFRERLVAFWGNHFTVSAARFFIAPVAGAFEREAIRPHVTGRFVDMLMAAIRHPAMLMYLDNAASVGPNSPGGRFAKLGLNENLAREILELHTLGVNGGYTQKDVTEFAKILTGWTVQGIGPNMTPVTGEFLFLPAAHEPGAKTLLGKRYDRGGVAEGEAALRDLARHPATAKFVATKLVRHFVADAPPPAAVERIARVFLDTDGDLRRVAEALVDLPEAWARPLAKVKSPAEFAISAARALGIKDKPERGFLPMFHTLRQTPFGPPSPAGWPDRAEDWISPEAMMRRIELARLIGRLVGRNLPPDKFFADTIAPVAAAETKALVLGAATPAEAVSLILASAEFQRR